MTRIVGAKKLGESLAEIFVGVYSPNSFDQPSIRMQSPDDAWATLANAVSKSGRLGRGLERATQKVKSSYPADLDETPTRLCRTGSASLFPQPLHTRYFSGSLIHPGSLLEVLLKFGCDSYIDQSLVSMQSSSSSYYHLHD